MKDVLGYKMVRSDSKKTPFYGEVSVSSSKSGGSQCALCSQCALGNQGLALYWLAFWLLRLQMHC